jgi:hypothetical protein
MKLDLTVRFILLHKGRFEVFMALAVKNAVFWDIKTKFYLTGDTLLLRYKSKPVNAL